MHKQLLYFYAYKAERKGLKIMYKSRLKAVIVERVNKEMKRLRCNKMKNFANIVKLVFGKKKYITELCGYYGNPQEVRDHLQLIVNNYQILSILLRKDIEKFDREVEEEYQTFLESQNYTQERQGGCYDCPWGNGEGGCTIPGYCNA